MNYSITPISPSKYAMCSYEESPYKTIEDHLAESLGGRWNHKAGAYILSKSAADNFVLLINSGWRGRASIFTGGKPWLHHLDHGVCTRAKALKIAKELTK